MEGMGFGRTPGNLSFTGTGTRHRGYKEQRVAPPRNYLAFPLEGCCELREFAGLIPEIFRRAAGCKPDENRSVKGRSR